MLVIALFRQRKKEKGIKDAKEYLVDYQQEK